MGAEDGDDIIYSLSPIVYANEFIGVIAVGRSNSTFPQVRPFYSRSYGYDGIIYMFTPDGDSISLLITQVQLHSLHTLEEKTMTH